MFLDAAVFRSQFPMLESEAYFATWVRALCPGRRRTHSPSLTDTVVVAVNCRLGQLGYLDLPELTQDNAYDSGSFGLMLHRRPSSGVSDVCRPQRGAVRPVTSDRRGVPRRINLVGRTRAASHVGRGAPVGYLKTLAAVVAADRVTVNLVLTGRIETNRMKQVHGAVA